ncbi:MAG: LexA family transcriptional regulator [Saprospiraceae bacterium]|nr:LexA family transcriptional regulator [Saprospiraceae bacterium]
MANDVSERFVLVVKKLVKEGIAKSIRKVSQSLDYLPQSMSEVVKGKRNVPVEVIQKLIYQYNVNPLFLFVGEGEIFLDENQKYSFKTLTLVTDVDNNERIVHVPKPAQAGYAEDLNDIELVRELPTYTLPDIAYQTGTYRSFDVRGDSMEPTLDENDILVCSYLEPSLWETGIRDHHVYVIVTRGDVVVKRVINNLRKHKHLELHSDNESYKMYRVQGSEIQEVWFVRTKISRFRHSKSSMPQGFTNEDIMALHQTIKTQADIINKMHLQ